MWLFHQPKGMSCSVIPVASRSPWCDTPGAGDSGFAGFRSIRTYPSNGIFTSEHQDRILSLGIKIGSLLQAWTMPSFITLTAGRVGLLCASTPQPLLGMASVTGAAVGRLCLSCHLSPGGLGGMGIASENKWLQRSSCLLPQHMALRHL